MLALSHHMMVQIAARRVGFTRFFDLYAVLGDDLVIAHKAVADAYLVVARDLGVEINLDKSLISHTGVLEFAKRLFASSEDISPVPYKLLALCQDNLMYLPDLLRDAIERGINVEPSSLKTFKRKIPLKVQYEVVGPLGLFNSVEGLSPLLGDNSLTNSELHTFIKCVEDQVNARMIRMFYQHQNQTQELIDRIGSLVWDGGVFKKLNIPRDTPAFHHLMNSLIEKTIEMNTSQPEQIR
jgi:hypothetical protein